MKKILTVVCCLALSSVQANVTLNNLIETDKSTCLKALANATEDKLWDAFLEGQSTLFFDLEFAWIAKGIWWQEAKNILDMGSGTGSYLYKLSQQFPGKLYKGIEIHSQYVKQATERYAWSNLIFQEGNAEVLDAQLLRSADIVLLRLTLQHLKNPLAALENAFDYLSPQGYAIIIDSYDKAKRSSHPIPTIDEALTLVAEMQEKAGKGNRKVTLELLQMLESQQSPLSEFYEVVSSNLDINGNIIGDCVCFQGEKSRRQMFNHGLLFLALLNCTYHIPVNLSRAYDELQEYLEDERAWTSPGIHLMVLKKKIGKR